MLKERIIKNMPLEKKIALCSGKGFWQTKDFDQWGIPSIFMADGPHGVRKQEDSEDMLGINRAVASTCFPCACLSACSFDEALLEKMGQAIALEAKSMGVSVVLGPGVNIKRDPLCGRNFEYFSEDPLLSGKLGAAWIKGVQAQGIGSSLKHFALNNQEHRRFISDSIVDERTMREIYLRSFEIAVKQGKPSTVMSAYNKINGISCCSNPWLLTDVLRNEWGFDGLVVTDWGAMKNRIHSFEAGCDLCMPGKSAFMEKEALQAIKEGKLSEQKINDSLKRVIDLAIKHNLDEIEAADYASHDDLACRIAEESIVLLKNENTVLPFDSSKKTAYLGWLAKNMRYQGTGSSRINPKQLTNPWDAAEEVLYAPGYNEDGTTTEKLIAEALALAKQCDQVVIFAGLPENIESEGYERENMKMPSGHIRLIDEITKINKSCAVVLLCGSAVEIPWCNQAQAIIYAGLPGQAGGKAINNIIFGKVNPSGKLAETWPVTYEDCVTAPYYLNSKDAVYREGIYVGYRYYQSIQKPVRYCFGHGLSYTQFEYSNLSVNGKEVQFTVKNTGARTGKEVAQVYVECKNKGQYRPKKELRAFVKIELNPEQMKEVKLVLDEHSFDIYDRGWKTIEGEYAIHVGSSIECLPVSTAIFVAGESMEEKVPSWYLNPVDEVSQEDYELILKRKIKETKPHKGKFTMDNTILEMKEDSLIIKLLCVAVEYYIAWGLKCRRNDNNSTYKMMVTQALDCSFSGMKISAGMKNYVIEGLLEIANGHWVKGIGLMLKK